MKYRIVERRHGFEPQMKHFLYGWMSLIQGYQPLSNTLEGAKSQIDKHSGVNDNVVYEVKK